MVGHPKQVKVIQTVRQMSENVFKTATLRTATGSDGGYKNFSNEKNNCIY